MTSLDDIQSAFDVLESWEDKYQYLIELGDTLPTFPEDEKKDENKVEGCMSQVWLVAEKQNGAYHLLADSDALIVKGLIAIVLAAYDNKTPDEIKQVPIEEIFTSLGLENNLSPTRRNGFFSLVGKIRALE